MRAAAVTPLDPLSLVRIVGAGYLAVALGCAILAPSLFWLLLGGTALMGVLFLVYRHNPAFTAAWLTVAAATLEMALTDLIGPQAFQPTIVAVKGAGLLIAAIAVLRYGPRLDMFNPGFAWIAIFLGGWAHGLYPGLSAGESLRSLIGSVAPFAFSFVRVSRNWADTVIGMTRWLPVLVVAAGAIAAVAGLRPLFIDSAGVRLAGLGHPAFLAGVCQTAVYACLIEVFRHGRRGSFVLLGTNLLLLLLTGARAPLTYALAVGAVSLLLVRAPAFPPGQRILVVLAAATTLALALLVLGWAAADLSAVRAFNVLSIGVGNLSGRDILWPNFSQAAQGSPWLGWGVGAGNLIIPQGSEVATLLHTRAAHNEYLRIAAEGGQVGRTTLILLFVLWVRQHTARLDHVDRVVMRLAFIAFAAHAFTDNLLISTPACVWFAYAAAVFARGRHELATLGRVRRY